MNKGYIISALSGAGFVAGTLFLGMGLPLALVIGIIAYIAGNLIFVDKRANNEYSDENLYDILNNAKKINSEICSMIEKIEDKDIKDDIREIYRISNKIINTISKNPAKQKKANNFFQYYLPVTLKILKKYDEIENQRLESNDGKEFMKNTKNMVETIKKSFNEQLSNLYQADMIDTDADIKVFKTMLKTDGYSDIDDFNIVDEEKNNGK